jgi:hypothetical protein
MALIECPECKKEISDSTKQCPHCGYSLESKSSNGCLKTVGLIVLVPVLLFVLVFGFYLIKEVFSPTDLSNNPSWAIDEGKDSLKANLKDPDSLEYGEVWAGRLKGTASDKGTLVACGYYNARNGFGGMTGSKRFIGSPGNIVLTDEVPGGEMMNIAWLQACVTDRVH